MPEKEINGNRMHYRLDGPEEGMVVLFSNSLGADLTMWDAVVAKLLPTFRVLRYDTRGHGQSPASGLVTMADLGGDVISLLDELAIPTATVCGLSMGGLIAQWLGER